MKDFKRAFGGFLYFFFFEACASVELRLYVNLNVGQYVLGFIRIDFNQGD